MRLINDLKGALNDTESILNIYEQEVIINKKVILLEVSNKVIKLLVEKYLVKISGLNLIVSEYSNLTRIEGEINSIFYEKEVSYSS